MSVANITIAFVGGGRITEIIIENLIKSQTVLAEQMIVSDPNLQRCGFLAKTYSVKTTQDNLKAAGDGDVIFVNVRPQVVDEIVEELSHSPLAEGKVLVTIAAGIPMEKYQKLGKELAIVRALPNPPSQIGKGVIAICFNPYVLDIQQKNVLELFDSMGKIVILREELMNTATALSSPASILLFFKSLIEAGVQLDLDKDSATKIAYQTIVGVLEVWKQRQVPPEELLEEACTPGGISMESVATLEKHEFRAAIITAIKNATLKAEQFSREL